MGDVTPVIEPWGSPAEGYCLAREDQMHCVHWHDDPTAACCSCGYKTPCPTCHDHRWIGRMRGVPCPDCNAS